MTLKPLVRTGNDAVARTSNHVVLREESCGRLTPTPNHHPSPLLSPSPLKGAMGKEEGATVGRLRAD